MTIVNLIVYLVHPAVAESEHSYIELDRKPVCQECYDTGVDSQFKGIGLGVCSVSIWTVRIESLALLERTSEEEVGKHGNALRSCKRDICPVDTVNAVFMLDLIAVFRSHRNVRNGKVCTRKVQHAAVV